jgi:hypothetical protein
LELPAAILSLERIAALLGMHKGSKGRRSGQFHQIQQLFGRRKRPGAGLGGGGRSGGAGCNAGDGRSESDMRGSAEGEAGKLPGKGIMSGLRRHCNAYRMKI